MMRASPKSKVQRPKSGPWNIRSRPATDVGRSLDSGTTGLVWALDFGPWTLHRD